MWALNRRWRLAQRAPSGGCKPCGSCVACQNIETTSVFWNSGKTQDFRITHSITCTTKGAVYFAICPCGLIYIGLTSRELRRRVREQVLGIINSHNEADISRLTPIARHFKATHGSDPRGLRVWGIDRILPNNRGGDIKKPLAQREAKWIHVLNTLTPYGLNDHLSFAPFL